MDERVFQLFSLFAGKSWVNNQYIMIQAKEKNNEYIFI
jgi:hypothetical protein